MNQHKSPFGLELKWATALLKLSPRTTAIAVELCLAFAHFSSSRDTLYLIRGSLVIRSGLGGFRRLKLQGNLG